MSGTMSHFHYCDYAGHEWECTGAALRPLAGDTAPSICMCLRHRVPMADGDHSDCPVELLTCPEHRRDRQKMSMLSSNELLSDGSAAERRMLNDKDGKPTVGFCLWCNKDFYSMNELEAHNSNESAACAVLQDFKNKQFRPSDRYDVPEDAASPDKGISEE
jgi:hypothetical protein